MSKELEWAARHISISSSKTCDMKLIFATNNPHKIDEIKSALRNTSIEVITLKDAGIEIDIPEP